MSETRLPPTAIIERAGAHGMNSTLLRPAQRFLEGVTTLEVARVMCELESGVRPYLSATNRWLAPNGTKLYGVNRRLSTVIHEMIRTGLVRHWRDREGDHLVPAKVHLTLNGLDSACHFVGEDMGPMRSRLVSDLALVDCLDCEAVIAHGRVGVIPTAGQGVKIVDAERAREIIEAGGRVHRDERYTGDYRYIVDDFGPAHGRPL